jgi:DNA-binding NarL/FixJ family response regulator
MEGFRNWTILGAASRRASIGHQSVGAGPEVVSQMLGRSREQGPLDELTDREREVLAAMAEGLTNRAISERLYLSERAGERHFTSIFQLGLSGEDGGHGGVLAVLAYLRE